MVALTNGSAVVRFATVCESVFRPLLAGLPRKDAAYLLDVREIRCSDLTVHEYCAALTYVFTRYAPAYTPRSDKLCLLAHSVTDLLLEKAREHISEEEYTAYKAYNTIERWTPEMLSAAVERSMHLSSDITGQLAKLAQSRDESVILKIMRNHPNLLQVYSMFPLVPSPEAALLHKDPSLLLSVEHPSVSKCYAAMGRAGNDLKIFGTWYNRATWKFRVLCCCDPDKKYTLTSATLLDAMQILYAVGDNCHDIEAVYICRLPLEQVLHLVDADIKFAPCIRVPARLWAGPKYIHTQRVLNVSAPLTGCETCEFTQDKESIIQIVPCVYRESSNLNEMGHVECVDGNTLSVPRIPSAGSGTPGVYVLVSTKTGVKYTRFDALPCARPSADTVLELPCERRVRDVYVPYSVYEKWCALSTKYGLKAAPSAAFVMGDRECTQSPDVNAHLVQILLGLRLCSTRVEGIDKADAGVICALRHETYAQQDEETRFFCGSKVAVGDMPIDLLLFHKKRAEDKSDKRIRSVCNVPEIAAIQCPTFTIFILHQSVEYATFGVPMYKTRGVLWGNVREGKRTRVYVYKAPVENIKDRVERFMNTLGQNRVDVCIGTTQAVYTFPDMKLQSTTPHNALLRATSPGEHEWNMQDIPGLPVIDSKRHVEFEGRKCVSLVYVVDEKEYCRVNVSV